MDAAVPVAVTPPAGAAENVTVGGAVYPEPGVTMVTETTEPPERTAVPVAVVPPAAGAENVTVGAVT